MLAPKKTSAAEFNRNEILLSLNCKLTPEGGDERVSQDARALPGIRGGAVCHISATSSGVSP
jgi:hypothetical protein